VAGIDSLPSEGMEIRMLVKLRIQNPNDSPVDFDGVHVKLTVEGKTFASGVSGERGTIPRYGEALVNLPVTVSSLRIASQAIGMFMSKQKPEKITYKLEGKVDRVGFGAVSFNSSGELTLPGSAGGN
jgi:LEA14-like dessication related protein